MMNNFVSRKTSGPRWELDKSKLPLGTSVVHYIVPVEVNGMKTQEIPVSELEANPQKYRTMFPQYFKKSVSSGLASSVKITPRTAELKLQNGILVKKVRKRTVADIVVSNSTVDDIVTNQKLAERKTVEPAPNSKVVSTEETEEELPFGNEDIPPTPKRRK